ncbi:unnamed protein product [Adineta ricciae]|uniref:Uncharacterized protein n=1 Tax=Adineta ricciae TaxID=249248 RepID=A0A815MUM6_ADIRI|nr:unnamed protein product [Adineta ricciae]
MRTALNISARVIHDEVKSVYGDEAPEETEDKVRPDKPITETTIENIEQVRLLIDDDPHMATEYIQEQTDLRKITACYVPKDLTGLQQTEQQIGRKVSNEAWIRKGDPPPTVVRANRFTPKT